MSNKDSEIKLQITRQKYARPSPRKHGPDGLAAFDTFIVDRMRILYPKDKVKGITNLPQVISKKLEKITIAEDPNPDDTIILKPINISIEQFNMAVGNPNSANKTLVNNDPKILNKLKTQYPSFDKSGLRSKTNSKPKPNPEPKPKHKHEPKSKPNPNPKPIYNPLNKHKLEKIPQKQLKSAWTQANFNLPTIKKKSSSTQTNNLRPKLKDSSCQTVDIPFIPNTMTNIEIPTKVNCQTQTIPSPPTVDKTYISPKNYQETMSTRIIQSERYKARVLLREFIQHHYNMRTPTPPPPIPPPPFPPPPLPIGPLK